MSAKDSTVSDSESKTRPAKGPVGADAGDLGAVVDAPGTPGAPGAPVASGATGVSPTHVTLAVVLQVREGRLSVLLWQRARDPFSGAWSLPGGYHGPGLDLEQSIRAHLARKVDVAELSWLEQLETLSDPTRHPDEWQLATAYLGLVPLGLDPALPSDTAWHPVDDLPGRVAFDHRAIVLAGRERLRAKLSYTNIGFALAPDCFSISELSAIYSAALGYPVDPTNLRRVLERRGLLEPTGERRAPGREGGRPAAVYRFASQELAVTDPFAVLRPPARAAQAGGSRPAPGRSA
ncbi:MAG: NUDIX hydrolase [Thermoleophilaceae bacterium]